MLYIDFPFMAAILNFGSSYFTRNLSCVCLIKPAPQEHARSHNTKAETILEYNAKESRFKNELMD